MSIAITNLGKLKLEKLCPCERAKEERERAAQKVDVCSYDYKVPRDSEDGHKHVEMVPSREWYKNNVYRNPMVPGYKGIVPGNVEEFGERYALTSADALKKFEAAQSEKLRAKRDVATRGPTRKGLCGCQGTVGEQPRRPHPQPQPQPSAESTSPYFMECGRPDKYFVGGYGGHVPRTMEKYGQSNVPVMKEALCEFTSDYNKAKTDAERMPGVNMYHHIKEEEERKLPKNTPRKGREVYYPKAGEVYLKKEGMIPNYAGHVPGVIQGLGKTFAEETVDAKRWIQPPEPPQLRRFVCDDPDHGF